jgi:ammonia channel protein AmtB
VAITAPCAFVAPWAACLIGGIAGVLVVWSVFFWEKRGIDDPVGAISVHGVNGAFGVICIGLFADGTYGAGLNGVPGTVAGLFYGGGVKQLTGSEYSPLQRAVADIAHIHCRAEGRHTLGVQQTASVGSAALTAYYYLYAVVGQKRQRGLCRSLGGASGGKHCAYLVKFKC